MKSKITLCILTTLNLFLSACNTSGPANQPSTKSGISNICTLQANDYISSTSRLIREWDDAVQLAGNTPKVSLPVPIAELQRIRRAGEEVKRPSCAEHLHSYLVTSMNETIEGFLDFIGNRGNSSQLLEKSSITRRIFDDGFENLKAGKDWC